MRAICLTALCVASVARPAVAATDAPSATAAADADAVHVLVLRENGAGSASTARKYIDKVMVVLAHLNGWPKAVGAYHTRRTRAETFIKDSKPQYGIVSLGAYLAMRKPHKLAFLGHASIRGGGGEQYYLVSKTAADLDGCKGQKLATNHGGDKRFVDNVISGDDFDLGDFDVQTTRRPVQTIKTVIADEATCALIDDAQMADLANIEGGEALHPVWFSAKLTPMVVVAFASASKGGAARFKGNLGKVCTGEGKPHCDAAGIRSIEAAEEKILKPVLDAYGK